MPRSILTEKVARRGHHLTREYSIDPLEALLVRQIATSPAVSVPASLPIAELAARYFDVRHGRPHQGYPVVDANGRLVGVVTRSDLLKARELHLETEHRRESIIKLPGGDLWQPFSRG